MNYLKTALMVALLLCVAVLAGCQEGNARLCGPNVGGAVLEPSATGFWYSKITSPAYR